MIAIGSKALIPQLGDSISQSNRERFDKSDFDVIMSFDEFLEWSEKHKGSILSLYPTQDNKYKAMVSNKGRRKQYEIELDAEGSSSKFLLDNIDEVTNGVIYGFLGETFKTLSMPYLMLTKRSHLVYPVHFEKNIEDYHLMKSILGEIEKDETMETYYKIRSAEAKERFKKFKTPKLNVTTEDFFSSKLNVPRYFVHDHMHEVMAHHDRPVYTMMQKDASKAWCEKDMFFALPYEYQVQCVQEEAYVISLERYIVPQFGDDWSDYFQCYKNAVKRICTTLCSGWFRDFAIENYPEVIKQYNPDFVGILYKAFKEGRVQPIEGKTEKDIPQFYIPTKAV